MNDSMERYTECKTNGSCRNKMQTAQRDDRFIFRYMDGSLFALLTVIHMESQISHKIHVFCLDSIIIIIIMVRVLYVVKEICTKYWNNIHG